MKKPLNIRLIGNSYRVFDVVNPNLSYEEVRDMAWAMIRRDTHGDFSRWEIWDDNHRFIEVQYLAW